MSTKAKTVWISRGPYPVYIGFCPSESAWRDAMKKMGVENESYPCSDAKCTVFESKGRTSVIITVNREKVISEKIDEFSVMGLLCHEAVHVAQLIFEAIGEGQPGSECEAYLVQYIFQELVDAYAKCYGGAR
jgi:hypothetical protein